MKERKCNKHLHHDSYFEKNIIIIIYNYTVECYDHLQSFSLAKESKLFFEFFRTFSFLRTLTLLLRKALMINYDTWPQKIRLLVINFAHLHIG